MPLTAEKLSLQKQEKKYRCKAVNELIKTIASCGRRFFRHKRRIAKMEIDYRGRIWIIDEYTQKRIYTHSKYGHWRGFCHGGTLRRLVEKLRDYIAKGKQITNQYSFGPWPSWYGEGDLWGYGKDMEKVRKAARKLGILKEDQPCR